MVASSDVHHDGNFVYGVLLIGPERHSRWFCRFVVLSTNPGTIASDSPSTTGCLFMCILHHS